MDEMSLMESIASWHRRAQGERLKAFGITPLQLRLVRLARMRSSLSLSAAARELDCDRPTMTLLARKCVASGWLARQASRKDGRSFRLELTGEGEEFLDQVEASRVLLPPSIGDPFEALDPEERAALRSILERSWARAVELDSRRTH